MLSPDLEPNEKIGVNTWFQYRAPGAGAAARRTLLHVAAAHSSVPALQRLLALGADPNATGDDGATPLHCACHARGDTMSEVLTVLLEAGADKELRDSLGRRPVDLLFAQVRQLRCGEVNWHACLSWGAQTGRIGDRGVDFLGALNRAPSPSSPLHRHGRVTWTSLSIAQMTSGCMDSRWAGWVARGGVGWAGVCWWCLFPAPLL